MPIYVTNPTDKTVYLRSFDGDSVAIHAKSRRVQVSQKFNWQAPTDPRIRVEDGGPDDVDPNQIVKGRVYQGPAVRPKGHHNKSRTDPMPIASSKDYYEKLARLNAGKAAKWAQAKAKIDERFRTGKK